MKTILPFILLVASCSDPPVPPDTEPTVGPSGADPYVIEQADAGPVQLPRTAPFPTVARPDPPCTSCPLVPISPH